MFELMAFDAPTCRMVRQGDSIPVIRAHLQRRGETLIVDSVLDLVKRAQVPVLEAYRDVFDEDDVEVSSDAQGGADEGEVMIGERGKRSRVLVVEDDDTTRSLLRRVLEADQYEVTVAADGIDALLSMGKTRFDVILSDIHMPYLDGYELLKMKQVKDIETPVVFLTSNEDEEDERKALAAGAAGYIRKPVGRRKLLEALKSTLGPG